MSLDCNRTQSDLCFVFKFVPGLQNVLDDQKRMEDFLEREVPQCQIDFLLILISSIFFCLIFRVEPAGLIPQNFDISLMLLTSTISHF